jgi:hypothetical protein
LNGFRATAEKNDEILVLIRGKAVTDEAPRRKMIEAGVTILAQHSRYLTRLALSAPGDDGEFDHFEDRGKLVFLSMMSHSIAGTLSKQNGCKEIANIWQELTIALSDVANGKSAELFRPLKEEEAQPRRISVHHEIYFSIAAGVYNLAEEGKKENVEKEIARKLKVKSSQLKNFRNNLTRVDPNIKSEWAFNYYDGVARGLLCVDENGRFRVDEKGDYLCSPGNPSSVANWLKIFDNLFTIAV